MVDLQEPINAKLYFGNGSRRDTFPTGSTPSQTHRRCIALRFGAPAAIFWKQAASGHWRRSTPGRLLWWPKVKDVLPGTGRRFLSGTLTRYGKSPLTIVKAS
jgi:hypothetical protein